MDRSEQRALVPGLKRMDEAAWRQFCATYTSALCGFVRYFFGCPAERAEQVVQMTFVRCVKSIHTFDPARGELYAWLKTVARNEGYSLFRTDGRHARAVPVSGLPEHLQSKLLNELDTAPLPDELLAREDVQILVQSVLLTLNSRYRAVLNLKYLEGRSVAEVANTLGITEKAAESALSRARAAFRKALSESCAADSMGT